MNYLSKEISEIKKFNKFGLLEISNHALYRLNERGITEEDILNCISQKETTIIQNHLPGEYNNNKNEVFVLYGKFKYRNKSKPLHIVIAKDISENAGKKYKIVTSYIPSNDIFYAYGRKLRR